MMVTCCHLDMNLALIILSDIVSYSRKRLQHLWIQLNQPLSRDFRLHPIQFSSIAELLWRPSLTTRAPSPFTLIPPECYKRTSGIYLVTLDTLTLLKKLYLHSTAANLHTRFSGQQFHRWFKHHSLLRTLLLQPGVDILYLCCSTVGRTSWQYYFRFL